MTGRGTAAIMESEQTTLAQGPNAMLRTIRLSSCISVQGEMVEVLQDGTILVRDGKTLYRGRPVEMHDDDIPLPLPVRPRPEVSAAP